MRKSIYLTLLLSSCIIEASSQLFVDQSVIHWIQSRPNVGLEYRWNKLALNLNYVKHRNQWMGLGAHTPSLVSVNKSKRFALGYKFFILQNLFFENKLDYLSYSAPLVIKGVNRDFIFNDNREVKLQNNLGVLMGLKNGPQFSLKAGYHFGKGSFQIPISYIYQVDHIDAVAYLPNGDNIYLDNYDPLNEEELQRLLQDYSSMREIKRQFNIDIKLYLRLTGKRNSVNK